MKELFPSGTNILRMVMALMLTLASCGETSSSTSQPDSSDASASQPDSSDPSASQPDSMDAENAGPNVDTAPDGVEMAPPGIAVLGNFTHDISSVAVAVIATEADGLNGPRDLEFHPTHPNQLWVLNRNDASMVIFSELGTGDQSSVKKQDLVDSGEVFMPQGAALAFSPGGWEGTSNFATIHEAYYPNDFPGGPPPDFMGPTLWTSNLDVFNGGHSGHLDMLHNTPMGMGIAWEKDNVYWVFDGHHSSITRYDFALGQGPGSAFADDGIVSRYVSGQVKREPDVVSHLAFDHSTDLLFIADTGNNRVATLATDSGTQGDDMPLDTLYDCVPAQDACSWHIMDDAILETFMDGAMHGISKPSALALEDDILFISDYETGTLYAFDKEGQLMDWLDLQRPQALGGMAFDSNGNLHVVDTIAHEIIKLSPQ